MRIRTRLFLTLLGLIAVGAGLLAAVVLWSFERFFLESTENDLHARAVAIAESLSEWLAEDDLERVGLVVRRYGAQEGIALRVLGLDGKLIATSDTAPGEWRTDWTVVPGVRQAMAGGTVRGRAPGITTDDERVFVVLPVVREGKSLGLVRMSRTLAGLRAYQRDTVGIVLGALGLVLLGSAGLSAFLARGLASPIQQMRNFAVRLGQGHLKDRLPITRRDELGDLAIELNRAAERLAALEEERRAFLANASHELRTPVSNVHVTLQALESGAGEDPELRGRFLATALEETERLRRLIQDLLDLGRLEAGVTGLDRVRVPVRGLIERCVRAVEGRARTEGVELVPVDGADASVRIDNERMTQALLAILDNALKLSPRGSRITITTRVRGAVIEIGVHDEGPGIDPADLPHVFEQFYTADRSRKRGGTGLGLAIARRIVDAHQGSISALSDGPGQGATFLIALPADDVSAPAVGPLPPPPLQAAGSRP